MTLSAAVEEALSDPTMRHAQSVIVSERGRVRLERYLRDRTASDLGNVHSITKSVVSTLVGIAIGRGDLALDSGLADIFGGARFDDERKAAITIEQLLTMTSGLAAGSPHDIDEIADRGESWTDGPLAAPLDPARGFAYNNGAVHVLGAALARASGTPLRKLAERDLFAPLGIDSYRWPEDPVGNPLAYGHLELRPRDLLRLGRLYLDAGRTGEAQVVPEWFVEAATTAHNGGGPPEGVPYGYLWWVTEDCGHHAYFAGGYAGQYLTVVPDLTLVVVTTGDAAVLTPTSGDLRRLVAEAVIPAL